MTKTFCDLCGEEIKPSEDVCYKVKKEQYDIYSWGGRFWCKLECHEDCWRNLCMILDSKIDFKKLTNSFCTNDTERRLAELSAVATNQFINKQVEFPTEKVGYWVYEPGYCRYMCSNCKGTVNQSSFFYCPWCGTKIDSAIERETFENISR